jgi:predicted amidohydrolase
VRVAAVQLDAQVGDVPANLEACERLADAAAADGAEWILLPEFFTTGAGFVPELADAALAPEGAASALLRDLARRHGATVGGSFLCRDPDGHVRNAFLLAMPDGEIAGRHDKDLPTMWENALYVGGADDGVIEAGDLTVGAAVCWEFMRTGTARRLRGRVDLVVGGSCWWSLPAWPPRPVVERLEAANERQATSVAPAFARYVGAPVVHAAHCGELNCQMPWSPIAYSGYYEGGASVSDARGRVLARRDRREGPGHVVADVEPRRVEPELPVPDRFWLHRRSAVAALTWEVQKAHGRRWYARNVVGRPPLELPARDEQHAAV